MNKTDELALQQKVNGFLKLVSDKLVVHTLLGRPLGPINHYRIYLTKLPEEVRRNTWPILQGILQEVSRVLEISEIMVYEPETEATNLLILNAVDDILQPLLKELKATYVKPQEVEPDIDFRAKLLRGEQLVKH